MSMPSHYSNVYQAVNLTIKHNSISIDLSTPKSILERVMEEENLSDAVEILNI